MASDAPNSLLIRRGKPSDASSPSLDQLDYRSLLPSFASDTDKAHCDRANGARERAAKGTEGTRETSVSARYSPSDACHIYGVKHDRKTLWGSLKGLFGYAFKT